jgi:gliding motility-associated-like protein
MKYFFTFLTFFIIQKNIAQYISVNETYTGQQLIEDVLINSPCASITNVTVSGANFASGEKSYGYFSGAGTTFPFQDGIILSTGKVSESPGPTTPLADSGSGMIWDGDSDLDQTLSVTSSNATVLEFDFIPTGDRISFDYIFSSEEYEDNTNYPCRFSDGFAFLLKAVGATNYQNLALIPNTNIPVKVTTVHPNITAAGGCPAENEQYFDAFNGTEHPTVYNGQTVVLTAQATVIPGTPYHIKLVIADEDDSRYDSAIFLKGGSFNLGPNLGDPRSIASGNPVCPDEILTIDATTTGVTSYQWFYEGNPIPGETNPILILTPPHTTAQNGTYGVDLFYSTLCTPRSEIDLEFVPDLTIGEDSYRACDYEGAQDGIRTFDLNSIIPLLFPGLPAGYTVAFFDSTTSTTPLALNYTNTTPFQQTIYARTTNIECFGNIPVALNVDIFSEIAVDETIHLCAGTTKVLDAGAGFVSYSWNTTPIQTTQSITIDSAGTYEVILENANGCLKTKTITVLPSDIAIIQNIEIIDLAENNTATIIAIGDGEYVYSLNEINYQESIVFQNLAAGEYTIFVKDKNGCGISSQIFYIIDYPKFFTPNGDGYNETWTIKNLDKKGLENSKIYIFDRYGKLLKQIHPDATGWNGTFNEKPLPSGDYWFVLELANGKKIKNHFSLKR